MRVLASALLQAPRTVRGSSAALLAALRSSLPSGGLELVAGQAVRALEGRLCTYTCIYIY